MPRELSEQGKWVLAYAQQKIAEREAAQAKKGQGALQKEVRNWVKQGYTVVSQTETTVSLARQSVSAGRRLVRAGAQVSTLGLVGGNFNPDRQETVYLELLENGKVRTTRGSARL